MQVNLRSASARGRWTAASYLACGLVAGCRTASPPAPAVPTADHEPKDSIHVVVAGETPFSIAKHFKIPVDQLLKDNGIEDPTRLLVGTRLRISRAASRRPQPDGEGARGGDEEGDIDTNGHTRDIGDADRALALPDPSSVRSAEPPLDAASSEPKTRSVVRGHDPSRSHAPSPDANKSLWIWPVDGVVTSAFGRREGERHEGIDISAPHGTPIWASQSGRVAFSGEQPGYGLVIIVEHADGFASIYAHNAKNFVVLGDAVQQGDVIAEVGDSGGQASPACHFEIRAKKIAIPPLSRLPP